MDKNNILHNQLQNTKFDNNIKIKKNNNSIIKNKNDNNHLINLDKKIIKKDVFIKKTDKFLDKKRNLTNEKKENSTNVFQNHLFHKKNNVLIKKKNNDHEKNINSQTIKPQRIRNINNFRTKKNNKFTEFNKGQELVKNNIRRNKKNRNNSKLKSLKQAFKKPINVINKDIFIGENIKVFELANKMAVKSAIVIKKMMDLGIIATINQILDQDTAQLVAEEMGHKVIIHNDNDLEEKLMQNRIINHNLMVETRAPIVTVMGHVDHGKTSLLDFIRSTKVAYNEAGGITQHIGAYNVSTPKGNITFLDTPGHAAFTSMRSRGVKITDIVVLIIAADDGVKPQTLEAIQHAKAAKVPIIVAINKIDRNVLNIDQIKQTLMQHGVVTEEWGGENIFVLISAKTGKGIDILLNAILLQAEMLELKAAHKGMAHGVIIESYLDKGKGPIATILIKEGLLKKGDVILSGSSYGKIRAMKNELGKNVSKAGPSIPVSILGFSSLPEIGNEINVVHDEKKAREVAIYKLSKDREFKLGKNRRLNLENIFENIKEGAFSSLNIILKSDVKGSLEAICESLEKLSNNEVKIKIIGSGVGAITETDTSLAIASNAIIIGFNVRADISSKRIIETENLDLRYYSVIYDLINDVKNAMSGMISPKYKQEILGLAEVRNVFKSPKFNSIAGCMVIEGIVKRNNPIRVLRDNVVIYEGELESLRRYKEDVSEVHHGIECGIGVKNYQDICVKDIIEVFEMKEVQRNIQD
ncbi:Translation initiation factor IF-2 [isoform beta'] [Buchnera aphidicola (Thelaxes suberi)]